MEYIEWELADSRVSEQILAKTLEKVIIICQPKHEHHTTTSSDSSTGISNFNFHSLNISLSNKNEKRDLPLRDSDPFKKFPDALRYLTLVSIPLYGSIRNITTLTELILSDPKFDDSLPGLFDFLKNNPSLEHVTLRVGFDSSMDKIPERAPIHLENLKFLSMNSNVGEVIVHLVSHIPLKNGAQLEISCPGESVVLVDPFPSFDRGLSPPSVVNVAKSPVYMRMDFQKTAIDLSGPNGIFSFNSLPWPGMRSLLNGEPQFPRTIELLHLRMLPLHEDGIRLYSLDPSLFPVLKTLAIEEDEEIATTLSGFLLQPSSLVRLEISRCVLPHDPKEFQERLKTFVGSNGIVHLKGVGTEALIPKEGVSIKVDCLCVRVGRSED